MSILRSLKEYIDNNIIINTKIRHSQSYKEKWVAKPINVYSNNELSKTVIVEVDNGYAMIVLPTCLKINIDLLKEMISRRENRLVDEKDFKDIFPDCEIRGISPVAKLNNFSIYFYFATPLAEGKEVIFNAGFLNDEMLQ